MARKTSKFMLGLFVTMGILIGVVIIIWVGASKYFEKGAIYATYFDESVQGLQVDSSVKYRGVDVGRVLKIRVAPDNRLVEVIVKIQLEGITGKDVVTELKSAGITGIVFIELDRRAGKEPVLGMNLPFQAEYPILASRPSDIKQIRAGLTDIYERVQLLDVAGISDQVKETAKSIERFFKNPRLEQAIQNLEVTTASLERIMKKLDAVIAEGKVDQILLEAREGIAESRRLIATLDNEIRAMRLADKSQSVERLANNLDDRSQRVSLQAEALLRSLRQNSEQLRKILERLQNKPSDLIFSDPSPADVVR